MQDGLIDGFFYGLYMDRELLVELGYMPANSRLARLEGFRIDLQGPIKIIPDSGKSVWGMIISLPEGDIQAMYSGPKTKGYQPYTMKAQTSGGFEVIVQCYNHDPIAGAEFNREYRDKLLPLTRKVGLPGEYLRELESLESL